MMGAPEYFRLAADQEALFNFVAGYPRVILNMACRVDIESEIDEEKAVEAMKLTVTRLPFCTIRLHEPEPEKFVQYYCDDEPEGFEIVDMSGASEEEIDAYILELAGSPLPNDYDDVQLYDFKLIRAPQGRHIVYFNGFHIIMDSVGLIYVITYFCKVYEALVNGTELPAPGIPVDKLIDQSWEYMASKRAKDDLEWWLGQFATEPHFSSMNPRPSPEYVEGKNYGKDLGEDNIFCESLPKRIPAEFVEKVNAEALKLGVSAQLYYMLALRTWLARNSGYTDVMFDTTGARRATLVQKNGGMTLAHQVQWRSDIPNDCVFRDALLKLNVNQRDIYKHIGILEDYLTPSFKRFGTPAGMRYAACVFTYQPYFNSEGLELKFKANHVNIGVTNTPLYLNMMPHDASGDIWADYIYSKGYLDPANLEAFHAFMLRFIENGIADPDKTIAEIAEMSL